MQAMTPLVGTCDTTCVDVCPMDCIHGPIRIEQIRSIPTNVRHERLPTLQLFINPEKCISCGACAPVAPRKPSTSRAKYHPHRTRPSSEMLYSLLGDDSVRFSDD
jgi:ferredoxin